jgi:hypothetical protein
MPPHPAGSVRGGGAGNSSTGMNIDALSRAISDLLSTEDLRLATPLWIGLSSGAPGDIRCAAASSDLVAGPVNVDVAPAVELAGAGIKRSPHHSRRQSHLRAETGNVIRAEEAEVACPTELDPHFSLVAESRR